MKISNFNTLDRLGQLVAEKNREIENISLEDQKTEVSREIKIRETVYSKMVANLKMTLGEKTRKINTMKAVLKTLEKISKFTESA